MKRRKIIIGCDDAAVVFKNSLVDHLRDAGMSVEDVGCMAADDHTNYPLIAGRVCRRLKEEENARGVLICGTGIGMCISANKYKGIRAAVGHDCFSAERSILSNDCNVICFGARVIGLELAKKILREWLTLEFLPSPSSAKIEDIRQIERETMK